MFPRSPVCTLMTVLGLMLSLGWTVPLDAGSTGASRGGAGARIGGFRGATPGFGRSGSFSPSRRVPSRARGNYRPPGAARLPRGGSRGAGVISDGLGGFTTYRQGSISRYIGSPASPGKIYHPDGSGSLVIEDESGNLSVYGPDGVHKVYRKAPKGDLSE